MPRINTSMGNADMEKFYLKSAMSFWEPVKLDVSEKLLKKASLLGLKTKVLKHIKKGAKNQNTRQHAHFTRKLQMTFQIVKHTPIMLKQTIAQCVKNAPHLEEKQTHMLNKKIIFNAFWMYIGLFIITSELTLRLKKFLPSV